MVALSLAGTYLMLYFEFREGLMGLDGQSIAVQVQDLRELIVPGTSPPRLALPRSLQEFYAQPDTLNGYQLLSADGTVLESDGFSAPYLPLPVAQGDEQVVMQSETDALSGNSILAAALDLNDRHGPYWLRVVRNLEDEESLVAQLMLGALDELYPPIALLLIAAVGVVVVTVQSSLRSLRAVSHQASMLSLYRLDEATCKSLLSAILGDGELVAQTYSPSATYESKGLVQWETLRDELMYKNRYFLDQALDTDRLKELLTHLPMDDIPPVWYRARVLTGGVPYPIDQMRAPPKREVSHGRANPPGIPYLYLGSLPETAIAEVRPHTGEVACVADFTLPATLNMVDLRNPRKLVSPFVLAEASAVGQLRADIAFLERLGDELTRPVLPRGAAIDYIPSQYLCEFIKKSGCDGVIYRSSVSSGINLALFDPDKATDGNVTLYNVTAVSVAVARV